MFLLLLLLMQVIEPKIIKLDTESLSNQVTFKEKCTILDTEGGFYKSIDTSISPDGKVIVFDRGNFLIHIYDPNGKKLSSFGKEGNGPGELSGFGRILAFKDRIIVKMYSRLIFFNYSGHLIREIKDNIVRGALYQKGDGYELMFDGSASNEYLSKVYDIEGRVIEEIKNPYYKNAQQKGPKSEEDYFQNIQLYMQQDYNKPVAFEPYLNGYVRVNHGDYRVEILDKKLNTTHVLTRDYERKKIKISSGKAKHNKKLTREQREIEAKKRNNYNTALMAITGGYRDAIDEIAGVYKGYLFLTLDNGEPFKTDIDIISPEKELISVLNIEDIGIEKMDEYRWASVKQDKLVLEFVSEEFGPYVKVFDITINEGN